MYLVGLTGGIGSGKSTVAAMLKELNCPIIDADQIAREVVEPGRPAWLEIRRVFGCEVFNEDGTLDRARLADIIFSDANKRLELNRITHPQIYRVMLWRLLVCFLKGYQFAIIDAPLLYETSKMLPYLKYVIVVYCSREKQMERLMELRGYSRDEAVRRIDAQMPLAKKKYRATHVIDNESSIDELHTAALAVHRQLISSRAHWKTRVMVALTVTVLSASAVTLYRCALALLR